MDKAKFDAKFIKKLSNTESEREKRCCLQKKCVFKYSDHTRNYFGGIKSRILNYCIHRITLVSSRLV